MSSPTFDHAREIAVAYIGIDHSKSSGRVRDNLKKKGVDEKTTEQVIEYLKSIDYVDDRRAAQRVARRYRGRRLRSKRAMVYVFLQNGIEMDVAKDVADSLEDDRSTALELCESMYPSPDPSLEIDMMKLLTRRGYHAGLARDVTKSYLKSSREDADDDYSI